MSEDELFLPKQTITLYDDQQELVDAVIAKMHQGYKRILMQSATGSGKSVMAAYMLHRAMSKGSKCWFTVPRKNLIRQMHGTFNNFDIPHSYIAAGMPLNPHSPAHICGTDTLWRRIRDGLVKPPKILFVDETHYGGNGLDMIIEWASKNGCWIIGLSATPWLLSGKGLNCWYDTMVVGKQIRWLIDNKRLSDYRPFAPTHIDLSMIKMSNGEYSKRELSEKMEQNQYIVGDAVKHYKENCMGDLGIAYCTSIKHSEMTADIFRANGVPAMHIDGETPDADRRRIIRAYANRELLYLTNCELLTFGFDLASQVGFDVTIEAMSDLRPTKSLALQMQKWGRVLRMKEKPACIYDHANNFDEHGMPCEFRDWTLDDRIKTRGGSEERAIPVKLCPECFFSHPPRLDCPNCGYEYPVESRELFEVAGELEEIEKNKERKVKRMEVGMAKTLDDLRQIREERGYKPDWVWKMAKAKGIKE